MEFREPVSGEVQTIVAEDKAGCGSSRNIFKIVNQLEIVGYEKRIPDGILPKLISGELRIPAAEQLTEEATHA